MQLKLKRSFYIIKRLIGRNYKGKQIQRDKMLMTYNIIDKKESLTHQK